jgi:hypothetical protein
MNCGDVKILLPGYLDGDLPQDEKNAVEEHLKTCQQCVRELEALKKAALLIRGLDEVEPPPFFSKKIMARVKAEQRPKRSLVERLFFPLHLKLPLEAVATVLIAVLAVFVYRSIEPRYMPASEDNIPKLAEQAPYDVPAKGKTREAAAEPAADKVVAQNEMKEAAVPEEKQRMGWGVAAQAKKAAKPSPMGTKAEGYAAPPPQVAMERTAAGRAGLLKDIGGAGGKAAGEGTISAGDSPDTDALRQDREFSSAKPGASPVGGLAGARVAEKSKNEPVPREEYSDLQEKKATQPPARYAAPPPAAPAAAATASPVYRAKGAAQKEQAAAVSGAAETRLEAAKADDESRNQAEFVVQTTDPAAVSGKLDAILSSVGARVVRKQLNESGNVYFVEMKVGKLGALKDKLRSVGTVVKAPAVSGELEAVVTVKIVFSRPN